MTLLHGLNGPLYASQGKRYTPTRLVEVLNKERLPWDTFSYNIEQANRWRWEIDFVQELPGSYYLLRDDVEIALLTSSYEEGALKESFDGFIPKDECTWRELRFIVEATGWEQPDL